MTAPGSVTLAASRFIPATYLQQADDAARAREAKIQHLIQQRKLPDIGWPEAEVESLLRRLSSMDSNNFAANCGVGEREARIFSGLVRRRHFGLGHGIGRSGDLCAVQPKAAGSSILNKLTNALVLDLIRQFGVRSCKDCFIVPSATGMAMTLCLLSIRASARPTPKFVVWSRIDQKSCFKSIVTAGFVPVVVELLVCGDELRTDVASIEQKIAQLGPTNVAAVITCTSCFAPRAADDVPAVARVCREANVHHIVNNAYGIQSSKCMHLIEEGSKKGRIDAFVQSTDKNLLVPVGGSIIAGFDPVEIQKISQLYPGRASAAPTIDVFITLLQLGVSGYRQLLCDRKRHFEVLKLRLREVADKFGERVLETKNNTISIAITLPTTTAISGAESSADGDGDGGGGGDGGLMSSGGGASEIGSKLFMRGVSGTRVVTGQTNKNVEGYHFKGWGSHSESNPGTPYLTAAAAVGMTDQDVHLFIKRLEKVLETAAQSNVKAKVNHTQVAVNVAEDGDAEAAIVHDKLTITSTNTPKEEN